MKASSLKDHFFPLGPQTKSFLETVTSRKILAEDDARKCQKKAKILKNYLSAQNCAASKTRENQELGACQGAKSAGGHRWGHPTRRENMKLQQHHISFNLLLLPPSKQGTTSHLPPRSPQQTGGGNGGGWREEGEGGGRRGMNESQHDQLNILPSPRGLYSLTALAASSFAFFRPQGAPDEISQRTGPGRTLEGCPSLSLSEGISVKVSASSTRPPSSESHATPRKSSFLFPLSLYSSLSPSPFLLPFQDILALCRWRW